MARCTLKFVRCEISLNVKLTWCGGGVLRPQEYPAVLLPRNWLGGNGSSWNLWGSFRIMIILNDLTDFIDNMMSSNDRLHFFLHPLYNCCTLWRGSMAFCTPQGENVPEAKFCCHLQTYDYDRVYYETILTIPSNPQLFLTKRLKSTNDGKDQGNVHR